MRNNKGQALVEFLLFLPLMLIIYSVIVSIAGAINGSINQQKIVRGYFYFLLKNDSMTHDMYQIERMMEAGVVSSGMLALGWKEEFIDADRPKAPCFKINSMFGPKVKDVCREAYQGTSTQNIRVRTVYGVCGRSYVFNGGVRDAFNDSEVQGYLGAGNVNICGNNE